MRGWLAALVAIVIVVLGFSLVALLLAVPVLLIWQGGWWAMLGLLLWIVLQAVSTLLQKVL
jgi:hypothetical protein